ncbi:ATP-binding cassette domain-containing protein [[Mycoplasma] collis]|uniref:ATP-binding cassette domain-containing protein n=1 Tax=[Mycoplasma] collis TaxID=2127 RepID=UPI00051B5B39|nr:ATP-binding cassette domain-containing protein [[Mycoplasma] collis]
MNKKVVLSVKNLKKYFHNKNSITKAIDDLSFDLHEQEIIGLIGESGSGKTTVGRTLIRLIEDNNGQIIVNDEIITGKTISKKKNRFLRQNVQMIFQDPHASLNPQKNIYSILKEPLKVNKIIDSKLADIFTDWEDVTNNFKYEFIKKYHKIKLDNLNIIHTQANNYFSDWRFKFRKINFDKIYYETNSYEEVFNSFYLYATQRSFYESNTINALYKNSSLLMNFYFEKQKAYREKKFSFDEKDLLETKKELKYRKDLLHNTLENYNKNQVLIELKNDYNELIKQEKENKYNAKKYLKNFINQFKNEADLNKYQADLQHDFLNYTIFYKKHLVNKKSQNILKQKYFNKNKNYAFKNLEYLSITEIDQLINYIFKFNDDVLQKYSSKLVRIENDDNLISLSSKDVKLKIYDEYNNLDLSEFFEKALENKENLKNDKENLKNKIDNLSKVIQKPIFNEKINLLYYQLAEKKYQKAQCVFNQELDKYLLQFNSWLKEIKELIAKKEAYSLKIKEKQKELDFHFYKTYNSFLNWLKNKLISENKDKNTISITIKHYQQKIDEQKENFARFNQEMKEINSLYYRILYLLRIHNNSKKSFKTKYYIKKILYSESIFNILEEVGLLRQFVYRYPHEFSGGQRQRIVIARALISEPKIIIADEPIASLDISIQAQIVNLLKEIVAKKKISMIFIAHDLSMIEYVADKILIMHLGKVVEQGKTEEIYSNPLHPYTINLFNSIPKISNANIPFKAFNFENQYLIEQAQSKSPVIYQKVKNSESHYVLGTTEQLSNWLNEKTE